MVLDDPDPGHLCCESRADTNTSTQSDDTDEHTRDEGQSRAQDRDLFTWMDALTWILGSELGAVF